MRQDTRCSPETQQGQVLPVFRPLKEDAEHGLKTTIESKGHQIEVLTGNDQILGSTCIPLLDDEEGASIVWLS